MSRWAKLVTTHAAPSNSSSRPQLFLRVRHLRHHGSSQRRDARLARTIFGAQTFATSPNAPYMAKARCRRDRMVSRWGSPSTMRGRIDFPHRLDSRQSAGSADNEGWRSPMKGSDVVVAARFLPGSSHEHVTDAAHGADNVRVRRIGLYLPAQAGDAQVDGAVERLHLAMRSHFQ